MYWQLESGLDDKFPIEEHLSKIFSLLEPLQSKLINLGPEYDLCIQCVGYFPPSGHGIHLDQNTVLKASNLGVAFDLDFYFVDDYGHDLDFC